MLEIGAFEAVANGRRTPGSFGVGTAAHPRHGPDRPRCAAVDRFVREDA